MTTDTSQTTDQTSLPIDTWRPRWRELHGFARYRAAFARFRRTRPFGGALVLAAGGFLVMRPLLGGTWQFYTHMATSAIAPIILGLGMIGAAVVALITPAQRHFPAVIATMFSIASLPLANLGGWIIGMVLGIVGAGLVFAWTPYSDKQLARFAAREQRRADRRAARKGLHSDTVAA